MRSLHYHFSGYDSDEDLRMKRHFLKIFTTKRRRVELREGVMSPEELKERVPQCTQALTLLRVELHI